MMAGSGLQIRATRKPGLPIEHYRPTRNFVLYDGESLLVGTVYRKEAEAVKAQLETDVRIIAGLTAQCRRSGINGAFS
jgi:hypothetical protein